jgi:hypothetical protein
VNQLLAQAEAADAAEDAEYGVDRRGDELPAELQRRESRLKRIREAKRALEARAKKEAAAAGASVWAIMATHPIEGARRAAIDGYPFLKSPIDFSWCPSERPAVAVENCRPWR